MDQLVHWNVSRMTPNSIAEPEQWINYCTGSMRILVAIGRGTFEVLFSPAKPMRLRPVMHHTATAHSVICHRDGDFLTSTQS